MTWRYTVKIKDLLSHDDVTPEKAQELGWAVAQRLRYSPLKLREMLAVGFEDVRDQDDFNACMDALYDEADRQRVWVE